MLQSNEFLKTVFANQLNLENLQINHVLPCFDQIGHGEQHVGPYVLENGIQVIPKREC